MSKRFRENMFDGNSSDDEYCFITEKMQDDDNRRNRLKCFNISRSIDSDDELNIDENNTSLDNEWKNERPIFINILDASCIVNKNPEDTQNIRLKKLAIFWNISIINVEKILYPRWYYRWMNDC
uniref:Uncharacterized protein n=1 Tax=Vespula pensylvanica TaxID=30213 RepID=A0A834NR45_VESPE|nr:hypothetical protein H0235_012589 [Vespula pensylvanica]